MPDCPICLSELENGLTARTSCGHFFHKSCVVNLLVNQQANWNLCPVCRADIRSGTLGTINDQIVGTIANLVDISIPGMGLGVPLSDQDLEN